MPCYRIPGAGSHAIIGPCDWWEYLRSSGSTISPHHPDQLRPQSCNDNGHHLCGNTRTPSLTDVAELSAVSRPMDGRDLGKNRKACSSVVDSSAKGGSDRRDMKGLTLNLYGLPQDKLARVEIP